MYRVKKLYKEQLELLSNNRKEKERQEYEKNLREHEEHLRRETAKREAEEKRKLQEAERLEKNRLQRIQQYEDKKLEVKKEYVQQMKQSSDKFEKSNCDKNKNSISKQLGESDTGNHTDKTIMADILPPKVESSRNGHAIENADTKTNNDSKLNKSSDSSVYFESDNSANQNTVNLVVENTDSTVHTKGEPIVIKKENENLIKDERYKTNDSKIDTLTSDNSNQNHHATRTMKPISAESHTTDSKVTMSETNTDKLSTEIGGKGLEKQTEESRLDEFSRNNELDKPSSEDLSFLITKDHDGLSGSIDNQDTFTAINSNLPRYQDDSNQEIQQSLAERHSDTSTGVIEHLLDKSNDEFRNSEKTNIVNIIEKIVDRNKDISQYPVTDESSVSKSSHEKNDFNTKETRKQIGTTLSMNNIKTTQNLVHSKAGKILCNYPQIVKVDTDSCVHSNEHDTNTERCAHSNLNGIKKAETNKECSQSSTEENEKVETNDGKIRLPETLFGLFNLWFEKSAQLKRFVNFL